MSETVNSGKRLDFITWLQFIGVVAVVFGHSMNSIPLHDFLDQYMKGWVYVWHIPLFFFVSAFLFTYKGGFERGYGHVFSKRFSRLLVPYLIWNITFIIPKILMSSHINDKVSVTPQYFLRIFLRPRDNILGHTWFLCALFEMFLLSVLFEKIRKNGKLIIPFTAVLLVLNCFGVSERFLAVGDLMKNAIYFWLGLILGAYDTEKLKNWCKDNLCFYSVLLLTVVSTVFWIYNPNMLPNNILLCSLVLCLFVAIQIKFNIRFRYMEFVSHNSFAMYILHWPVMMVVRFVFYTKLKFDPVLTMVLMFASGMAITTLIVFILRKFKSRFMKKLCSVIFGM